MPSASRQPAVAGAPAAREDSCIFDGAARPRLPSWHLGAPHARRYTSGVTPTRDQVKAAVVDLIQTDLKFTGMEVPDDLQLVGGGLALDSLDLLMLVTGIEKRFGHKIPHKKLGKETMATVGAFVDFAHAELASAPQ